ncbi:MAG: hypothetical protein A2W99_06635 [Bacteroidetes bacterium GWF2_33_16]|nr:MAG: hypothetical protein A2X00_05905 [Bacteroidetes bacterium GWE2_32_14]OFY05008.1 MAG: hypothetical protein A2W99_06635 [Bacteroidetes bacterium GWF2_33_16]
MKFSVLIFFLIVLILFSCKRNHEKDLNYIHLEQISKRLASDLTNVEKDLLNAAQIIQHKIDFEKGIDWEKQHRYILNQNNVLSAQSDENNCAVFLPSGIEVTQKLKKTIINSEPIDTLLIDICYKNRIVNQVYFLDTNSFLRIFPYINVGKQFLPTIRLTEFNTYKTIASKPFFENKAYWINDPYADPSGRGWIISCVSPLYYHDQFFGIISADIMLKSICEKHLSSESEMFIIINTNGELLSCTKKAASFLKIPLKNDYPYYKPFTEDIFLSGNPSLLNSHKKNIRKAVKSLIQGKNMVELIYESNKTIIYSSKIKETNWLLLKIIN